MISRWLRRLLYWYHFYRHDGYVSVGWQRERMRDEEVEQEPWGIG